LLSYLKSIRNDEANGGPGELSDWNTAEKVNEAIKSYQENYFQKIKPYQSAPEDSDKGKA